MFTLWLPLSNDCRERIQSFLDEDTFEELNAGMVSGNPLKFPGYEEKLEKDQKKTGLNEAIVTGIGNVNGIKVVIAVMDSTFSNGKYGFCCRRKNYPVQLKRQMSYLFLLLFLLPQVVQGCRKGS